MRSEATRGFTLVEILIALVITGILASGVISLLMSQNSFYQRTDDLIFAEQSLRATADLVSHEVRMAAPADLETATPSTVEFRYDVLRGVVCHEQGGNVFVYVYDEVTNANVSSAEGVAFRDPYTTGGYVYEDGYVPNLEKATGKSDTPAQTCDDNGGPTATDTNYQQFRKASWGGSKGTPQDGAVIRLYTTLSYSFGASGFTDGVAIFRGSQELAAPFAEGASFSYVMNDMSVESNPTTLANVRRVRVNASAIGIGANRYDISRDLDYDIPLRNTTN